MEKKVCLLFLIVAFTNTLYGQQFLYPIAQLDDENVLLMYQKTSDDLELLIWNRYTAIASKELTSLYIPAYVQLLPSKTAYSFLDRGRIRIKSFQKRAPKTLDIFQPLCDIQSVHWITDEQCYFVAKYRDHYKIFMYDIAVHGGSLYNLTDLNDSINYIFPSKVGDTLFCLIQSDHGLYTVATVPWTPVLYDMHLQQHYAMKQPTQIIGHDHPLCFLSMQNEHSGFVLELLEKDVNQKVFKFVCCAINFNDSNWTLRQLFEIVLPDYLMIGYQADRLYESIYPLLPKYSDNTIYFTNYDALHHQCRIYQYNITTSEISICHEQVRNPQAYQHIFAPLIIENQLYTGCSYDGQVTCRCALQINECNGVIHCDIPFISR